jgi:hypothetical protein
MGDQDHRRSPLRATWFCSKEGVGSVQQIRIERKRPVRSDPDRYAVLPLDPRDPDIVRAKLPPDGDAPVRSWPRLG